MQKASDRLTLAFCNLGECMSTEIFWLTAVTVYTLLLSLPYSYVRISKIGVKQLLLVPPLGDAPFEKAWAHRAYRAHMNAIENLGAFAALTLSVHVTGASNATTELAAAVFFWARLAHAPSAILKIPVVRTVSFVVSLGACVALAHQILIHP